MRSWDDGGSDTEQFLTSWGGAEVGTGWTGTTPKVPPYKRLVTPLPVPHSEGPVKLGRFGVGLRQLSSCPGLGREHSVASQRLRLPGRPHCSQEHQDRGDVL